MDTNENVHCKVQCGMYGLPQAGIIAQELLAAYLLKAGYTQLKNHAQLLEAHMETHQFHVGSGQLWHHIQWQGACSPPHTSPKTTVPI